MNPVQYERNRNRLAGSPFRKAFDSLAGHCPKKRAEREAQFLCRAAEVSPGSRILDLGSGPGRHALSMARAGMRVVALDQSRRCLAGALRDSDAASTPLDAIRAEIESLPFAAGFDFVLMLRNPFHFRPPLNLVVQGIAGVMRRGGRLALEIYNKDWFEPSLPEARWEREGNLFQLVRKELDQDAGIFWETDARIDVARGKVVEYVWWTYRYSLDYVRKSLHDMGLVVSQVYSGLEGEPWAEGSEVILLIAHTN